MSASAATGAYAKGKAVEHAHESHHHVMPIKTYMQVFGALLVLTVITVAVSYMDLGPAALPVAMLVAVIKAGFVIGYFMHLKFDTRFHAFVFFSTIVFVAIFFVLTFFDVNTRHLMNPTWDNKVLVRDAGKLDKPPMDPASVKPLEPEKLEALRRKAAEGGGGH
ncbi:MAG: cytochrome C oxidase subunit IV family protein [Deltaproteobacteria bacterium]|nr:cytochrome C oxidase subunit IV family protein [Deltaproteobacteria bacterium]